MLAKAVARVSKRGLFSASRATNTWVERYSFPYEPVAVVAQYSPYLVKIEGSKIYECCSCGHSEIQPWVDGKCLCSKKEQGFRPLLYKSPTSGFKLLCGCKQCSYRPEFDGTCYLKYMEDFPLLAAGYVFAFWFTFGTVTSYYWHP